MTTINQEEIQKFSKLADEWWDANGKFKPLHAFNPIRIKYIIEKCKYHTNIDFACFWAKCNAFYNPKDATSL